MGVPTQQFPSLPSGLSEVFHPRTPIARSRLAVLVALVLVTSGAWALIVQQARTMDMPMGAAVLGGIDAGMDGMGGMASSGMATANWSVWEAVPFVAIWAVMMAAMMLPAAAPMVLVFDTVYAKRRGQPTFVPTWIFVAGYLLVWTAVGLVVYVLVRLGSDLTLRLGTADRKSWAPLALGATLVTAGLYQFTPLKRICLTHCRSPLGFVLGHWREGRLGALRMGLQHGAYCLGCCWMLFAVLVVMGIMSLAWMVLLTLVVFVEKVFPQGRRIALGVGAAFIVLGALVATGATRMPWGGA
jgi:predicted metal-binding membrane protein